MNANIRAMTQVALGEILNATIGDNDPLLFEVAYQVERQVSAVNAPNVKAAAERILGF
jgi:hypothetical protein